VPRRGPEAGSPHGKTWFNDFHGSGANSCSCPFLLSQKTDSIEEYHAQIISKIMMIFSALSRAVFKIMYPAGNCPQYGHGLLGLMEIPALGINIVIVL